MAKLLKKTSPDQYTTTNITISKMDTVTTVKISKEVLFQFDQICSDINRSRSLTIENIMKNFIEHWKDVNGQELFDHIFSLNRNKLIDNNMLKSQPITKIKKTNQINNTNNKKNSSTKKQTGTKIKITTDKTKTNSKTNTKIKLT